MNGFSKISKLLSLIIFVKVLSSVLNPVAGQMRQMYTDSDKDNHIEKLSFYSPSSGFVAFTDWIGFTSDSGRTFTKKYITLNNVNFNGYNVNFLFGFGIKGVKAFDQNNIIAYGDYGLVPAILSSSDGGNTFKLVYHLQYAFYPSNGIADMVFPQNDQVGYAINVDQILKTTDKGKTWTPIYTSPNSAFDHLEAVDNNNVFVVSDNYTGDILSSNDKPFINNKILKTTNGGSSWQKVNTPSGNINNVFFLTANKGWLSVDNDFYYTSNGGTNWTQKNNSEITPFYGGSFKFINDSTGFALAGFSMIKTTDSGRVWEFVPSDNNYSYLGYGNNDLQVLNNNQLWSGGGHGFLEINTNIGAAPFPRAYFAIDTSGVNNTSTVNLINYSKKNYQYKWYVNNLLVSTNYNTTYTHQLLNQLDSIKLIVTNGVFSDTTITHQYFIVPNLPIITSFSPMTGSPGTFVTINGSGFTNVNSVKFGGVPASSFTAVSDAKITATVGNGASGQVEATDRHGTFTLSGFTYFPPNVQPPPVITSISPLSGPVGTMVTITGNNFGNAAVNNIVYFGATKANLIFATPTQITCKVPVGASFEPITVLNTTNHETGQSLKPFNVTFADSGNFTPSSFVIGKSLEFPSEYYSAKEIRGKDIDGDGKPDMITVIEHRGDSIAVYRNTTTAYNFSFEPRVNIGIVPVWGSGKFDINDLDGDGKPDIVAPTNASDIVVIRNKSTPGTISFDSQISLPTAEGTQHVIMSDLDNDGKNDIVVAVYNDSRVSIIRNTSVPGFLSFEQTKNLISGGNTKEVAVGDLDGDGKKDIVAYNYLSSSSNNRSNFSYFKNKSTAGNIVFDDKVDIPVQGIALDAEKLELVDYDNDNKLDVVIINANNVAFFRNISTPGNIAFAPVIYLPFPVLANTGHVSNLNGDAMPDIAASLGSGKIWLYGNTSTKGIIKYDNPAPIPAGHLLNLNSADFNMDGKMDLVYGSLSGFVHSIIILKNNMGIPDTFSICVNSNTSISSDITGTKYQWQQNSGNGYFNMVDSTHTSGTRSKELNLINVPLSWNGYKFRCLADSNFSTQSIMYLKSVILPSVSISASDTTTCIGSSVTFKATVINPGMNPYYQWQINGKVVSAGSEEFITNRLKNNDSVRVIFSNSQGCNYSPSATSRIIIMEVNETVPAITISTPLTSVCQGVPVTFTATANGKLVTYQWKINGYVVKSDSIFTVSSLKNNDVIYLTASIVNSCGIETIVTSNPITMNIRSGSPATVTISSNASSICTGENATFTAFPQNSASSPTYQWQVDNVNQGTNNSSFTTSSLNNGSQVRVIMKSSATDCTTANTDTSNVITIAVNSISPSVTVTASHTNICPGANVTFTANPVNGGSSPQFQWKNNGRPVGDGRINYTNDGLQNGDVITVTLTSNAACASPLQVTSNPLPLVVNSSETGISISGNLVVISGQAAKLMSSITNGGKDPNYQWQDSTASHSWQDIPGAEKSTLDYIPALSGDKIRCRMISSEPCAGGITATSNVLELQVNSEEEKTGVKFYPNPVLSSLTIDSLRLSDKWESLEIVSLNGLRILVKDIKGLTIVTVQLNNLGSGMYIAILRRNEGEPVYIRFVRL